MNNNNNVKANEKVRVLDIINKDRVNVFTMLGLDKLDKSDLEDSIYASLNKFSDGEILSYKELMEVIYYNNVFHTLDIKLNTVAKCLTHADYVLDKEMYCKSIYDIVEGICNYKEEVVSVHNKMLDTKDIPLSILNLYNLTQGDSYTDATGVQYINNNIKLFKGYSKFTSINNEKVFYSMKELTEVYDSLAIKFFDKKYFDKIQDVVSKINDYLVDGIFDKMDTDFRDSSLRLRDVLIGVLRGFGRNEIGLKNLRKNSLDEYIEILLKIDLFDSNKEAPSEWDIIITSYTADIINNQGKGNYDVFDKYPHGNDKLTERTTSLIYAELLPIAKDSLEQLRDTIDNGGLDILLQQLNGTMNYTNSIKLVKIYTKLIELILF